MNKVKGYVVYLRVRHNEEGFISEYSQPILIGVIEGQIDEDEIENLQNLLTSDGFFQHYPEISGASDLQIAMAKRQIARFRNAEQTDAIMELSMICKDFNLANQEIRSKGSKTQDSEALPKEFRNEGKMSGNPLTAKYVKQRYGISKRKLSESKTAQESIKVDGVRSHFYAWTLIKRLADEKI